MKIKYNNIKSRFDYNPRHIYYEGFEDDVVNVLIKKGYDAEWEMRISQMVIVSTAPKSVLKEVISDIDKLHNKYEEDLFNKEWSSK